MNSRSPLRPRAPPDERWKRGGGGKFIALVPPCVCFLYPLLYIRAEPSVVREVASRTVIPFLLAIIFSCSALGPGRSSRAEPSSDSLWVRAEIRHQNGTKALFELHYYKEWETRYVIQAHLGVPLTSRPAPHPCPLPSLARVPSRVFL